MSSIGDAVVDVQCKLSEADPRLNEVTGATDTYEIKAVLHTGDSPHKRHSQCQRALHEFEMAALVLDRSSSRHATFGIQLKKYCGIDAEDVRSPYERNNGPSERAM